jgi:hypothetical protein
MTATALFSLSKVELSVWEGWSAGNRPPARTIVRTGLPEFTQLRRSPELWDRVQFPERRGKGIRETPDRPRPEFLVLRLEVRIMHAAGQVFGGLQSALDERSVDDYLGRHIRQFALLQGLHLLSHGLEVSLHSINAYRDAVDERERLRVFCEH